MAADWGGDSDAEGVYESLDTKDLEVEIQVGGRKRKYEEVAADEARQEEESFLKIVGDGEDATTVAADARGALAGEGGFAADVEDSEDEGCQLVVCHDKGAKAGGMAYYLGVNGTSSTAKADAEKTPEELKRLESTAEIVTQEESVESIMKQLQFRMEADEMADTQWRMPGANLQDFFNFNLEEKSFKDWVLKQVRMRLEARQRRKIGLSSLQA
eukprot:TRINITY_DN5701_c0_g1_i4.p1 TRINITY_DN5701_c0_g1~~TRINITY_DN5701_c0_g1_i4.p1  ORF type:complete len:237 (+),score=64.10 TRINITY_DN5701_c0_g1_i4:72-713(+)